MGRATKATENVRVSASSHPKDVRISLIRAPLFPAPIVDVVHAVFEFRELAQKHQVDIADGTVALLREKELGKALQVFTVWLINFFAINETDEIGVLLD